MNTARVRTRTIALSILTAIVVTISCAPASAQAPANATKFKDGAVLVYCGRSRNLVQPLFKKFEKETGIKVLARYGNTAELVAKVIEEGDLCYADVFFAKDAGALGALAQQERLQELPLDVLNKVDPRFRAKDGKWVGISGQARTIVYSTTSVKAQDVPDSVLDLTDPKWEGRIAWAPTDGSFQGFVTAMRHSYGERETGTWLDAMVRNGAREYPLDSTIVRAVGAGEVQLGLVNHYSLLRFQANDPSFPAANKFTRPGDPGSLVNVAGVGIIRSKQSAQTRYAIADIFIRYLLSDEAQQYFATQTFEYPLVAGVKPADGLVPIDQIKPPDVDLSDLADLDNTLLLLKKAGALP